MRPRFGTGLAWMVVAVIVADCNSGNGFSDAGADGGKNIGDNPNVTAACQTCLNQSSGNDCATQRKNCLDDSSCAALNACVNKCANINSGCVNNCGMAASANAIAEWTSWYNCGCADCGAQCDSTFCGVSGSDAGSDAAPDTGVCTADDQPCPSTGSCCSACACDNYCGCIAPNQQCANDCECCSGFCDQGSGTCQ
jgi:hypothetical protein